MRKISIKLLILALVIMLSGCSSEPALSDAVTPTVSQQISDTELSYIEELYQDYQKDPKNRDNLLKLINAYQDRGDDFSTVAAYKQYLEFFPNDAEILVNLAYAYMNLGNYDEAQKVCERAIASDNTYASAYNALGNLLGDKTEYNRAIEYYRRAIEINKDYGPARTNILWALYHGAQYDKCIEEAKQQIKQGYESYDHYYYLGACYEAIHEPSDALRAFRRAMDFNFDDHSTTLYRLGWLAYLEEDYESALEYAQTALKINPQNQDILWLMDELEALEKPLASRLARFMKDDYLYPHDAFQESLAALESFKASSIQEISNHVEESLHPNDPYSFILWGRDYDDFMMAQEDETVVHATRVLDDLSYELFTIETFNRKTGLEFIRLAEALQGKEQKVLVFDVRGNTGGDMKACTEILDYLLGECAVVNYIDARGYVNSYYSSADKASFKQIVVLTDQRTASAAELLALGLKVYIPETVIIGDTTYGKGVSQKVFDSPTDKVVMLMANTYWNVREINIDGYGITPDIKALDEKEIEIALKDVIRQVHMVQ
jgi:tetratricopeptide (TPR) repeat protein